MNRKTLTRKVINTYRPIERHWFAALDFVQYRWYRFARSDFGRFLLWYVKWQAIVLFVMLKVGWKISKAFLTATIIVGGIVTFVMFGFMFSKRSGN